MNRQEKQKLARRMELFEAYGKRAGLNLSRSTRVVTGYVTLKTETMWQAFNEGMDAAEAEAALPYTAKKDET